MGAKLSGTAGALGLAHSLFPEAVAAALARGGASLGPLPADFSPITEPAVTFDPVGFASVNSPVTSSAGISLTAASLAEPT
jgi:hypothetical protein